MEVNSNMQELDLTGAVDEQLQEEEADFGGGVIELGPDKAGASELAQEVDATADGFEVRDFKCVACGLTHGHTTDKHRASDVDGFDMSAGDAGDMDMNPNCHCGVHELAARPDHYGVDGDVAQGRADKAPVPEHVHTMIGE